MLKIWGRASSSNVQKVLWCCAELDIEFERVDVGGPFGGNRDPDYLAMNPNGLVPTVKDDDLVMWESNTICRYLAVTRNGEHLYPRDPAARTNVERWMDWQFAVIGPPMDSFCSVWFAAPRRRATPARSKGTAPRRHRWSIVEDAVKDRPYLAGDHLSLAEIVLGTQIYRWFAFPIERPNCRTCAPGTTGCTSGLDSKNTSRRE